MYHRDDPANYEAELCTVCDEYSYFADGNCENCERIRTDPVAQRFIGEELFEAGKPRTDCENKYQREGWDEAEDKALDEEDSERL